MEVTATNADGTVSAASAPTGLVASAPPVEQLRPDGQPAPRRARSILTATQGSWTGVGNSYGYQWQSSTDGGSTWSNVAGATGATYTLGVADEGAAAARPRRRHQRGRVGKRRQRREPDRDERAPGATRPRRL